MKVWKCDECKTEMQQEPVIRLMGIGPKAGILLPHGLQTRDFCRPECFWRWVHKNNPHDQHPG